METVTLNSGKPAFTLWGSEDKISTEILKVLLKEPLPEQPLQLEVLDVNGMLLYSKPLIPKPSLPDELPVKERPEVPVNKRFIFSGHLTFRILARAGEDFELDLEYL